MGPCEEDHIRELKKHFHLGDPDDWSSRADKILIREMWSSPIVFRRASKHHALCEDAGAWASEARRRVALVRDGHFIGDGDRILILGEDIDGKTDDLGAILIKTDQVFSAICGNHDASFEARLLAPLIAKDEDEEEIISKNNSSVILRLDLKLSWVTQGRYLFGGDAGVGVWDRVWDHNEYQSDRLAYDVLIAPHHCSWHCLSEDSWSDLGEDVEVSAKARKALGQARSGALILSSSKSIIDDDSDPPCVRAKREYEDILSSKKGEFRCIADGAGDDPLVIEVLAAGPKIKRAVFAATVAAGSGIGSQPFAHGRSDG